MNTVIELLMLGIIIALGVGIITQYRIATRKLKLLDDAIQQMQEVVIGLYEVQQKLDGEWKK